MVSVTRAVSLALADDSVRRVVFRAIQDSPFPEHKVHFRTFTDGAGHSLLAAAANVAGMTVGAMKAMRDSAVDLEMYLPVRAHFDGWVGDDNLIVATSFDVDDDLPTAFDLGGNRVALASAKIPPSTPVLAIVRAESGFRSAPQPLECDPEAIEECGGGGGGGNPQVPGLFMTFSYINDDFEGFLGGDPEFEVFPNWRLAGSSEYNFNQCSGAEAGNPVRGGPGNKTAAYQYDQNGNYWYGDVMLLDSTQLAGAEAVDTLLTYWVFEDDNTPCVLKFGAGGDANAFIRSAAKNTQGNPEAWRNRFNFNPPDPLALYLVKQGLNIVQGLIAGSKDDIVGLMASESTWNVSYGDANVVIINPDTKTIVGRAQLVRR